VILTIILTIKYKLPASLAGGKLSYTDSLNKNSQQTAIAKAFTNSYCYTMLFWKLPKNSCNTGGAEWWNWISYLIKK